MRICTTTSRQRVLPKITIWRSTMNQCTDKTGSHYEPTAKQFPRCFWTSKRVHCSETMSDWSLIDYRFYVLITDYTAQSIFEYFRRHTVIPFKHLYGLAANTLLSWWATTRLNSWCGVQKFHTTTTIISFHAAGCRHGCCTESSTISNGMVSSLPFAHLLILVNL